MKEEKKIKRIAAEAGKAAKGLLDHAVDVIDQTGDGKLDKDDLVVWAGKAEVAIKKKAQVVQDGADDKKRELEEKLLRPIFPEYFQNPGVPTQKLVRVVEMDKWHEKSVICRGAVGYWSAQKHIRVMNLFRNDVEALGLTICPRLDYGVYYIDPTDSMKYIAVNQYFDYLRDARVSELKKIAQTLGARRFKVTYVEKDTADAEKKGGGKLGAAKKGSVQEEHQCKKTEHKTTRVEAETELPPHLPKKPQLKYWKNDPNIETLIEMRLDEHPLLRETYTLKQANCLGMKKSEAVEIDTVLKGLKCAGKMTIASQLQRESQIEFMFEIEF